MADISAELVKELRERTGAGFMDCKKALTESDGDLDKAVAILRERGLAAAAKKSSREAREGLVSSYIHTGGRVGVLIEVNCETDFVARNDDFQKLVRDLAIQVAGLAPRWVAREDVPDSAIEARRAELQEDPRTRDDIDAHLERWLKEVVLLDQPFRDTNQTVRDLVTNAIATIGENIVVRRFTRYALGEEL
jgi:elongation factor Ts